MSFAHKFLALSVVIVISFFPKENRAESWELCLMSGLNTCQSEGGNPSIFVCSDWVGEPEACLRCTDIPPEDPQFPPGEFFIGCGGPEDSKQNRNSKAPTCSSTVAGSIIDETNGNYIKSIPVRGTGLDLVYSSNKVSQRSDDYEIDFEVFESTPIFIPSYDVEIQIAGRVVNFTNPATTHNIVWDWNGLDVFNQQVKKPMPATVTLTMAGEDIPLEFVLGNANIEQYGLGSWALSHHHFYGAEAKRLYLGSGNMITADSTDMGGGIRAVISDSSSEVYTFNSSGYHLQTLSALTGEVLYAFDYNGSGHLTKVTDSYGNETLVLRNGSGNFIGIESPDGQVSTVAMTGGKVTSLTTPEGDIYTMTYNSTSGLLETFAKPTGQVTTFTLDAGGSIEKAAYSGGNFFEYLFNGVSENVREYTRQSAMGREKTIRITNDGDSVVTETISPLGVTETIGEVFGTEGGMLWQRGDSLRQVEMTEDPRFGELKRVPSTVTETQGTKTKVTNYSYGVSLSNPLDVFSIITLNTTQNINSRVSTSVYTGATNTWVNTSPEGRTLTTVVDDYEKPLSEQMGGLTPSTYVYDSRGRLESLTRGARQTEYTYNSEGFVSQVENALGQITSYTYDDDGKIESATLPDLRVIGYKYDANDNLVELTPAGKPTHNLLYNAFELLQQYLPPVLGGTPRPINYVYNNDKELIKVEKPDDTDVDYNRGATTGVLDSISVGSTTLYAYDYSLTNGLMTEATSFYDIQNQINYEGDLLVNMSWIDVGTSAQLGFIANTYDNNFWVVSQSVQGITSSTPDVLNFTYDDDGLITNVSGASYTYRSMDPLLAEMNLGLLKEEYAYNTFGELTSKETTYNSSAVFDIDYTRDALGRVATKTEDDGTSTHTYEYVYDVSGRLEEVKKDSVTVSTYVYDDNNNRTGGNVGGTPITATYDNQDRLLTYNDLTFTYNHNGERAGRADTTASQTTSYDYNALGQLEKITLPSSDEIQYAYDGLGRRVARSYNGTPTDLYVYENDLRIVADLNPSTGEVKSRYVYVSQSHSPDFMIRAGESYQFVKDHLGSVKLVIKVSDGSITQAITYDEFGKILTDSNPGFQPFGFAGGVYDHQASLTKFGVRDYDPEVGRWLTKDPILFNGGDANLYGYVLMDPVNFVDPEGAVRQREIMPGPGGGGGGRIQWFTRHGNNAAIDGAGKGRGGVKPKAMLDAVKNPQCVRGSRYGETIYEGRDATVILNDTGGVITTWPNNSSGRR